jgi:hypothetical protein
LRATGRRDFRHIKSDHRDLRPVFHRLEKRVKGHVLICMLAAYLTWHLRQAWAPLTYTDEELPAPANPVAPAKRSASAEAKASAHQRTTPGIRAHHSTYPAHPAQVARTRRRTRRESAGQRRSRHPNWP